MHLPWPLSDKSNTAPRSAASKRFSEFFHGTSYVGSRQSRNHRGRKASRTGPQTLPLHSRFERGALNSSPSGSRSPTSIRSIIDPNSSPSNSSRPPPAATFDYTPSSSPVRQSEQPARQYSNIRHRQPPRWRSWRGGNRLWLSSIKNKTIRKRVITSIVFGVILALIFIICKLTTMSYEKDTILTKTSPCTLGFKVYRQPRISHCPHLVHLDLHRSFLPLAHSCWYARPEVTQTSATSKSSPVNRSTRFRISVTSRSCEHGYRRRTRSRWKRCRR